MIPRLAKRFAAPACFLVLAGFVSPTWAEGLKYSAAGLDGMFYKVRLVVTQPKGEVTYDGIVTYVQAPDDPSTDKELMLFTRFVYGITATPVGQPPRSVRSIYLDGEYLYRAAKSGSPLAIDPTGRVTFTRQTSESYQLGAMSSYWFDVALPIVSPEGKPTWTVTRDLALTREDIRPGLPPRRIARKAKETSTYTAGPASPDGVVTVSRKYEMATNELRDGRPLSREAGEGSFEFDTRAGRVKTMSMSLTDETFNAEGALVTSKMDLRVEPMPPDELAKHKAQSLKDAEANRLRDQQREAARSAEEAAKKQAEPSARAGATPEPKSGAALAPTPSARPQPTPTVRQLGARTNEALPDGVVKTQSMGGNGGSPFVRLDDGKRPVIGFHIKISEWGGKGMLGEVEPLYETPKKPARTTAFRSKSGDEVDVLAKDGYAVGGAFLSGPDYARAIRVIFMKKTATGLDPKQAYVSPWYGGLIGEQRVRVGGTGKFVAGVFGRQGLNTDQLGLLMYDAAPATQTTPAGPKDPTDDPNFGATPGKP